VFTVSFVARSFQSQGLLLRRACGALGFAGVLVAGPSACKPKATRPAPTAEFDLKAAARQLSADLAQQIGTSGGAKTVVIDPLIDRATGQQTGASSRFQEEMGPALTTAIKGLSILPFDADGAAKARYVLAGTVSSVAPPDRFAISASLTDRPTGLVVAQSAARFVQAGLDAAPTKFYNDSPSLVRDRSVDGYVRTAETKAGSPADALYVSQVPTAALLANALAAYNAEKWEEALEGYTAAAARPDGQQLRTFNGIYLSNIRLNRTDAAADAFGKIAALGLATNNLAVKLLFKPNSATDFWPGRDLSGVYPMWLRQISKAVQSTGGCLDVTGHTSRSGSEALNDKLSLARAETVKRMMVGELAAVGAQLQVAGVGYRQNIVGTGADNASDAVDRRVEFKVVECKH
jgi:outer membrane protein OmpA-like peptidoglycan-associated protein